jgi:hypothetical protein
MGSKANLNAKKLQWVEFGRTLEDWRSQHFRSALAFCNTHGLSVSYKAYADFERGVALPSMNVLLEVAKHLKVGPLLAALRWTEVQMPDASLKDYFRSLQTAESAGKFGSRNAKKESPRFDNTWVMGPADQELLKKNPWLIDLVFGLLPTFPAEKSFTDIVLPRGVPVKELLNKQLKDWIKGGYLIASKKGIRLRYPFVQIPDNDEWFEFRQKNFERVAQVVLGNLEPHTLRQSSYREILTRTMTPDRAKDWVKALTDLAEKFGSNEFTASPASAEKGQYSMLLLFGPRQKTKRDL